jgi:hypothetical protein
VRSVCSQLSIAFQTKNQFLLHQSCQSTTTVAGGQRRSAEFNHNKQDETSEFRRGDECGSRRCQAGDAARVSAARAYLNAISLSAPRAYSGATQPDSEMRARFDTITMVKEGECDPPKSFSRWEEVASHDHLGRVFGASRGDEVSSLRTKTFVDTSVIVAGLSSLRSPCNNRGTPPRFF